jgi:hypothetical protein
MKNQMESARGQSLYHKEPLFCDLSDEIPAFGNFAIGNLNQMGPGATLCPTLPTLPYWGMMIMRL